MKKNDALRMAILALHNLDQKFRRLNLACDAISIDTVDEFTSASLVMLIRECGYKWPDKTIVGEKAAHAAAMIARHCDHLQSRQQYFHALMKQCKPEDIDAADEAYLLDRICVNANLVQLYGTQMREIDSPRSKLGYRLVPKPLRDSVRRTNIRRKKAGLPTIAQQIDEMYRKYGPNKR